MTTQAENDLLTSVGPRTPMGEFMRQYWIPAALSSELVADGAPVRLMLLGEKLVAFRDSNGKVGIFDHRCPHRCASLFFGRNEKGGIRCVYHGWKFDTDGNCLETPNIPAEYNITNKVKAAAYKVQERNGMIWVFLGKGEPPALPEIEPALLPEGEVDIGFMQRDCNWLQALEGDIDTSHYDFLHLGFNRPTDFAPNDPRRFGNLHRDPKIVVQKTDWGTMYGAYRPADPGETYWRVAHFLFPFLTLTPNRPIDKHISIRGWIPLDDHHTMTLRISRKQTRNEPTKEHYLPNTSDWLGRWRPVLNSSNDYMLDRDKQRNSSFTGIEGTHHQDQAVTESMGSITDRTWENLVTSDMPIAMTRNRILQAVKEYSKNGSMPQVATDPACYRRARGGFFVSPESQNWLEAYQEQVEAAQRVKAH